MLGPGDKDSLLNGFGRGIGMAPRRPRSIAVRFITFFFEHMQPLVGGRAADTVDAA